MMVALEIAYGFAQGGDGVMEASEPAITVLAQQPAYLACGMVMVNR